MLEEGHGVKGLGEGVLEAGIRQRARLFYIDENIMELNRIS